MIRKLSYCVFALLLISSFYVITGKVSALDGTIDSYGPSTGSSSAGRAWFAVGNGGCPLSPSSCNTGFQGSDSIIELYSLSPDKMVVNMQNPSSGCSSSIDSYSDPYSSTKFDFYANNTRIKSLRYGNAGQVCGTTPDIVLGQGTKIVIDGQTFYRIRLFVDISSSKPYLENSFRINIVNNTSISYVSVVARTDNYFTGIYQKDATSNWSQAIDFATPNDCSAPGGEIEGKLAWFDADFRKYNPNLHIYIQKALKDTNNWQAFGRDSNGRDADWSTLAEIGDSGDTKVYTRGFNINYKYRLIWDNIAPINTIQIRLPFDQINSKLHAPNCPTGDGKISSEINCKVVSFTPYWKPSSSNTITGEISISGGGVTVKKAFTGTPNKAISYDPFNIAPAGSENLPLHASSYNVSLVVEGKQVATANFGTCLGDLVCSYTAEYEYGDTKDYPLTYRIDQSTSRTFDSRYSIKVTTPPTATINSDGSSWMYKLANFKPTNSTSVVGQIAYKGALLAGKTATCDVKVIRFPYVKAYNAGVMSSGGFVVNNKCLNTASNGIFARMRPKNQQVPGGKSGSGSQLTALTYGGEILGFATANIRSSYPSASDVNMLAFSGQNADFSDPNNLMQKVGDGITGNPSCIPDYFSTTKYLNSDYYVNDSSHVISQGASNNIYDQKQVFMSDGDVAVAGIPNYSGRTTYYVNGDVIINGNISYKSYSTLAQIPNFTLVVKGNIYIAPNVTQLDGVYIAQPKDDGTKGIIYTCHDGTTNFSANPSLNYTNCSGGSYGTNTTNQLVFNGSVIAKRIVLNRAVNTLSDSSFQERANTTKAAEVFNFSPEVLLSPPVFRAGSSAVNGLYNSMAILPPIF